MRKIWLIIEHAWNNSGLMYGVTRITAERIEGWLERIDNSEEMSKKDVEFRRITFFEEIKWFQSDDFEWPQKGQTIGAFGIQPFPDEDSGRVCTVMDRIEVSNNSIIFAALESDYDQSRLETYHIYHSDLKQLHTALSCNLNRIPLLLGELDYEPAQQVLKLRLKED